MRDEAGDPVLAFDVTSDGELVGIESARRPFPLEPVGTQMPERTEPLQDVELIFSTPTAAQPYVSQGGDELRWTVVLEPQVPSGVISSGDVDFGVSEGGTVVSIRIRNGAAPPTAFGLRLDPALRVTTVIGRWGSSVEFREPRGHAPSRPSAAIEHSPLGTSAAVELRGDHVDRIVFATYDTCTIDVPDAEAIDNAIEVAINTDDDVACEIDPSLDRARMRFSTRRAERWVTWSRSACIFGIKGDDLAEIILTKNTTGYVDRHWALKALEGGSKRYKSIQTAPSRGVYGLAGWHGAVSGGPEAMYSPDDPDELAFEMCSINYSRDDDSAVVRVETDWHTLKEMTPDYFDSMLRVTLDYHAEIERSEPAGVDYATRGRELEAHARSLAPSSINFDVDGESTKFKFLALEHVWAAAAIIDGAFVRISGVDIDVDEIELETVTDFEEMWRRRREFLESYRSDEDQRNAEIDAYAREYLASGLVDRDMAVRQVVSAALEPFSGYGSISTVAEAVDEDVLAGYGGAASYLAEIDRLRFETGLRTEVLREFPGFDEPGTRALQPAVFEWSDPPEGAHIQWGAGGSLPNTATFSEPDDDEVSVGAGHATVPIRLELRGDRWWITTDLVGVLRRAIATDRS